MVTTFLDTIKFFDFQNVTPSTHAAESTSPKRNKGKISREGHPKSGNTYIIEETTLPARRLSFPVKDLNILLISQQGLRLRRNQADHHEYFELELSGFGPPPDQVQALDLGLLQWKRERLGNVQKSIMEKQGQLDELQRGLITVLSKGQAMVLARAIDKLREVDELYWCQRSRVLWRLKGDRNTTYFHALSAQRARTQMEKDFTSEDIKNCFFCMHGAKAPGPDGMPANFFQHYWPTVGGALCDMFNFTLITLVPKLERAVNMTQFRPIALCNTAAKVIAKALAIRLKKCLPFVILDTQSAFVPHRLITDNILLAYEAHHVIKQRKAGPRCYMSIKLDMLKAYDRIEWAFLRAMLNQLGI
ncbi:hypothetical protein LIER_12244 [Lithospermum erythrorhizon]|uniref:Reverse transcriptase domain-containing protein n=1 Tax=Lithospermum erythrorhizon TaxID=34254 RepID=A0AAV3PVC0_LITER